MLTGLTIERLEALQLARRVPEGIQPLPAIARYALAELKDADSSTDLTLL